MAAIGADEMIRRVEDEKDPDPFLCSRDGCIRDFPTKDALLKHLAQGHPPTVEKGEAMPTGYACDDCPRTFDTQQGLKTHRTRTHSGQKPAPAAKPANKRRAPAKPTARKKTRGEIPHAARELWSAPDPAAAGNLTGELRALEQIVTLTAKLSPAGRAWLAAHLGGTS